MKAAVFTGYLLALPVVVVAGLFHREVQAAKKSSLDNRLVSGFVLDQLYGVTTVIRCQAVCLKNKCCDSFFFNKHSGLCQTTVKVFNGFEASSQNLGTKYYILKRVSYWIVILNATFDSGIQDDSQYAFSIGRDPWASISVESVAGANGLAARAQKGTMPLWFTSGNNWAGKLHLQFRFMVISGNVDPTDDIVLLSIPACNTGLQTLRISYKPVDQRYSVIFRDLEGPKTSRCHATTNDPYEFHKLDLIFCEVLTLSVDGVECFADIFHFDLMETQCYMALGGMNFDGYIDEVVFRRGCLD